ncbi:MAG: NAD(P)/FAD-dependent oxidoreductase [Chloroflexi bacterium]|nr:NAD(P)/FAD-dependent oxidoreductase [Chloroflexota bacterium]
MRVVIIGNSATAVGAIEALREHDQRADVTVVSAEPHMIYSRPMLSHYLAGEVDRPRLAYRGADFYARHNVRPLLNDAVVRIDPECHSVTTASGQRLAYDKLLIATGGNPIVPPLPGLDVAGVYAFTRLDDAVAIHEYVRERGARHAVVIGGGMIGIKATDALVKRGLRVTMVELAPAILARSLDEVGSRLMTARLLEVGVEVLLENTVTEVHSGEGRLTGVQLRDGRQLDCELLIFGIGVRPNAALAREAGLKVNQGIVVDDSMRTSHPDIYAAGDVAEAYDLVVDMNRIVAIWPNAYRQGATAGAHMVGVVRADPGGVAMNTVEVCGLPAVSVGDANTSAEGYQALAELDERSRRYKRLVLKDGRLVGVILVGDINRAGVYTGLIRNRIDVSGCERALLGDRVSLLSLPDRYRKHVVTGAGIEV